VIVKLALMFTTDFVHTIFEEANILTIQCGGCHVRCGDVPQEQMVNQYGIVSGTDNRAVRVRAAMT
jgi:hypothetical protein